MIEFREMRYLLSLDEHRHFSRAADAVGVSQPALTKSLQRIEQALGAQLFDRSSSRVTPTAIGEVVIERARRLLVEAADLKRTVDLMCGGEIGAITVGIGPAMAESFVPNALALVAQKHPHTQIRVRVDHWLRLSALLLAGELDFYIADTAEVESDARLLSIRLPAQRLVWYCRAGHPLALRERISRTELVEFPLATPKMPPWATEWFAATVGIHRHEELPTSIPCIECENYSMLKRIVLSSNCISAALESTLRVELAEGALVVLPVDAPELTTDAGIVLLRDKSLSPLGTELIASIQQHAIEAVDAQVQGHAN